MDNAMDPELASEMVKLLGKELKVVREREQTLISENDALKMDNAALHERIVRFQRELPQLSSVKSEGDVYNTLLYDAEVSTSHASAEFARLLAENENLIREKEEASRNEEKLAILQEKYRRIKAKGHEYCEVLNELRIAFSNSTRELEQLSRKAVSEIDFRDVLKDLPYEPVEGQPEISLIQSYRTRLLKGGVKGFCKGPYLIDCNEVVWSPSGIALGLVVKPVYQYNPKTNGGGWTKVENNFGVGEQLDVCYSSEGKFRYLGTYERVGKEGTTMIATETLKHLDGRKMDHISKRTTLYPDLVPPSQVKMIGNMYKQGVIKLQCFGIRCVAYNLTFAQKLRGASTTSAVPRSGQKRKRDSISTAHSAKRKKRCGPSPGT